MKILKQLSIYQNCINAPNNLFDKKKNQTIYEIKIRYNWWKCFYLHNVHIYLYPTMSTQGLLLCGCFGVHLLLYTRCSKLWHGGERTAENLCRARQRTIFCWRWINGFILIVSIMLKYRIYYLWKGFYSLQFKRPLMFCPFHLLYH